MLGLATLLILAQVLIILEPIRFTSEVHVLGMSEPLLFLYFLKHFSLFLKIKHCNGMYNGNGNYWGSHVLERLEIPKDETTSNHFQTSGSSPPGSREGSLYDWKKYMSLKLNVKMLG